jgi:hypothetical protein
MLTILDDLHAFPSNRRRLINETKLLWLELSGVLESWYLRFKILGWGLRNLLTSPQYTTCKFKVHILKSTICNLKSPKSLHSTAQFEDPGHRNSANGGDMAPTKAVPPARNLSGKAGKEEI